MEDVEEILKLLHNLEVTLKLNKCVLFKKEVDHLGHTILSDKLESASAPTKEILETSFLTYRTRMRSFLAREMCIAGPNKKVAESLYL